MISKGSASKRQVFLTFDDGPGKYTNKILDILGEEQVPAVFFWQSRLFHYKRPWQRLLKEGHKLGLHSHLHVNLEKMTFEEQCRQLLTNAEIHKTVTGTIPELFRPPYGRYNQDTLRIAAEMNLSTVLWNISSFDWINRETPENIVRNVRDNASPGAIILLHELPQTVEILEELIRTLKQEDYSFSNELV
ncbi:polysaccharide deacetylase family protein [Alkalicoccus daliensis]|uniref:Peptidoglycan/xylan/chitin deacetylase, PgdA/CDA1 family n=1 Tax=Alkalicoccus daliensis TaxID=745820 RepID=A0A1H0AHD4_9BACI|nr:polysaccharide deacetylase family protein [Alkalicoccus daliensis]SDN32186.1 Peptidoglycan/xylan/chitin deacetylase, PgdA/CDA1 family [Alkalicoccus daliensis]